MDSENMNNDSLVSIITPVYNSEYTIEDTITSVIKQSYKNWELIIIDDMSSDKSIDIIKRYVNKYKNIKVITNDINMGVSNSRNRGVELSIGKYIAFLDSDDTWEKDKLSTQIKIMLKTKISE